MGIKNYVIYDNGGKTIDRYTLVVDGDVYKLSSHPLSAQGVNSFCCKEEEMQLGKLDIRIELKDLPLEVYQAVWYRVYDPETDDPDDFVVSFSKFWHTFIP
jgi:hypothetical protein